MTIPLQPGSLPTTTCEPQEDGDGFCSETENAPRKRKFQRCVFRKLPRPRKQNIHVGRRKKMGKRRTTLPCRHSLAAPRLEFQDEPVWREGRQEKHETTD